MSLKAFHVVFITASVALAFFVAAWCFRASPEETSGARVAAGLVSVACGVGLAGYEVWFLRKMRGLP